MSLKSLKKLRRQKLKKDMNGVHSRDTPHDSPAIDDSIPVVRVSQTNVERDPDCMYSKSCNFGTCLGCRKLK